MKPSYVLTATLMLAGLGHAQQEQACPAGNRSMAESQTRPSNERLLRVVELTFLNPHKSSVHVQRQAAAAMKEKELPSEGRWLEYIQDLVNDEWHQRGYMKAKVELQLAGTNTTGKLTEVMLFAKVSEGLQYRLGEIWFKGGTQFTNDQLRGAFPLTKDGVFNVEEFRKGLETLRRMYGERGYINFTSVPDLVFDDESRLISVEIELDEHIQYFISDVAFLGVTAEQERLLRQDEAFLPGAPFNASLIEGVNERHSSLPTLQNLMEQIRIRQHSDGRMSLLLDFRPCPTPPEDWEGRDSEARPELRRTAKD